MSRRRDDAKRNSRLTFWQRWERNRHPLISVDGGQLWGGTCSGCGTSWTVPVGKCPACDRETVATA